MKKLSAIILALLITASVATGCAKDDPVVDTETNVETELPSDETLSEGEEAGEAEDEVTEGETEEAPVEGEGEEEVTEPEPEPEEPEVKAPVEGEVEAPVEGEVEEPVEGEVEEEVEAPAEGGSDVADMSAADIIGAINAIDAPEFMCDIFPDEVVKADADAIKYYTGLDSDEGIKDIKVHESIMGSQAYSLVVVKVEDAANAKAVAEAMKAGIDQRKWMCVEADDLKVSGKGDTVMLIMVDSEYAESITAAGVTEAFKTVCGGSLDFEL